jgi:hypothetical protein
LKNLQIAYDFQPPIPEKKFSFFVFYFFSAGDVALAPWPVIILKNGQIAYEKDTPLRKKHLAF